MVMQYLIAAYLLLEIEVFGTSRRGLVPQFRPQNL